MTVVASSVALDSALSSVVRAMYSRAIRLWFTLVALPVLGCSVSVTFDGPFTCERGVCPDGLTCVADRCVDPSTTDAGIAVDGSTASELRRTIAFSTGGQTAESVPILVRLDETRIDYGAAGDGSSVHFVDSDDNVLSHELEQWQPGGTSLFWVRFETVEDGDEFELRYGRTAPSQSAVAVFSDHELVLHFGGTSAEAAADSSPVEVSATFENGPLRTNSFLGGAISLDGLDDFIDVKSEELLADRSQFALSAWVRTNDDIGAVIEIEATDSSTTRAFLNLTETATGGAVRALDTQATNSISGPPAVRGLWQWLVFQVNFDEKTLMIFYDGALIESAEALTLPESTIGSAAARAVIGRNDVGAGLALAADLDEVRIGTRVETAASISIQYAAMTDELLEFGPERSLD